MSVPVKRWQLLIAEIIFEYNEKLCKEKGWDHKDNSLDDYNYDEFLNLPDFVSEEFGEFKTIELINHDPECEMIFSWRGKFYKFIYDYYSYEGYRVGDTKEPMLEVEPIKTSSKIYSYV